MLYVILFWTAKLYPGCQRLHAADTEASNRTREKKPLVPAVAKLRLLIYETIANNYDIKLQIFSPVSLRRLCKVVTVSCVHAFFLWPYNRVSARGPGTWSPRRVNSTREGESTPNPPPFSPYFLSSSPFDSCYKAKWVPTCFFSSFLTYGRIIVRFKERFNYGFNGNSIILLAIQNSGLSSVHY